MSTSITFLRGKQDKVQTNNYSILSQETNDVWKQMLQIHLVEDNNISSRSLYQFYASVMMPLKARKNSSINAMQQECCRVFESYEFCERSDQLAFKFLFAYLTLCVYVAEKNEAIHLTQAYQLLSQLIEVDLQVSGNNNLANESAVLKRLLALSYHSRALCHSYSDRFDEELADDLKVIELEPHFSSTYYNIGLLYSHERFPSRNLQKSLEYFNKCLDYDVEKKEALMGIVSIHTELAEYDKAIEYCEKVLSIDQSFGQALHSLGMIYYFRSDYQTSLQYYSRALSHFPNDGAVHYNIALIYEIQSKSVLALEKMTQALQCQPRNNSWIDYKGSLIDRIKQVCTDGLLPTPIDDSD